MRQYLLAPLISICFSPVQAYETCFFISEYEPDLIIEVSTKDVSETTGYVKYKGSSVFRFATGIRNGYESQYFSIGTLSNSLPDKEESIVSGSVITIVGEQSGTGTPRGARKQGLNKVFFPNFGLNYYYSFADNANGVKERSKKMNSILNAAEGFWVPSEICKKYVPYGW